MLCACLTSILLNLSSVAQRTPMSASYCETRVERQASVACTGRTTRSAAVAIQSTTVRGQSNAATAADEQHEIEIVFGCAIRTQMDTIRKKEHLFQASLAELQREACFASASVGNLRIGSRLLRQREVKKTSAVSAVRYLTNSLQKKKCCAWRDTCLEKSNVKAKHSWIASPRSA
jgi:hypothetical protein